MQVHQATPAIFIIKFCQLAHARNKLSKMWRLAAQQNYGVNISRMLVWVSLQSCLFNKHTMVVVVGKPADDGAYFVDTITKKVSLLSLRLLASRTLVSN